MNEEMTALLEHAKSKYKNLDCLADVYSFQILWGSERLFSKLGYSRSEFLTINTRDLLVMNPNEFMKMAITQFTGKPVYRKLKTKSGKIIFATAKDHSFIFENSPYVAITDVVFENPSKNR